MTRSMAVVFPTLYNVPSYALPSLIALSLGLAAA